MTVSKLTQYRLFALLIVAGILGNALYGLRTGDIGFFRTRVKRSVDPFVFWFAVLLSAFATIVLLVGIITGHLD